MTRVLVLGGLLVGSVAVAAQAPAAGGQPAGAPSAAPSAPTAPAPPTPPANFVYAVDGRRDPFVALLGTTGKKGGTPTVVRAEGVAGITTDELSVKGLFQSQGTWVALVSGPAGKAFNVRPGTQLADGTIREITPQYLVILQQVNDPLSLEKQREVKKFLRGGENK